MATRRVRAAAVAAFLAVATAGCGGGGDTGKKLTIPGISSSPSGSPTVGAPGSASPTASPTGSATPFDNQGDDALRGTIVAGTAEEQAVADAWLAYWQVRASSFFRATVDPRLGSVAGADAVAQVVQYVNYLRSKGLHTVGDTTFGVSSITVTGRSARLTSCGRNLSVDRKADGSAAEALVPYYDFTGLLTKVGGTWRVVGVSLDSSQPCHA